MHVELFTLTNVINMTKINQFDIVDYDYKVILKDATIIKIMKNIIQLFKNLNN